MRRAIQNLEQGFGSGGGKGLLGLQRDVGGFAVRLSMALDWPLSAVCLYSAHVNTNRTLRVSTLSPRALAIIRRAVAPDAEVYAAAERIHARQEEAQRLLTTKTSTAGFGVDDRGGISATKEEKRSGRPQSPPDAPESDPATAPKKGASVVVMSLASAGGNEEAAKDGDDTAAAAAKTYKKLRAEFDSRAFKEACANQWRERARERRRERGGRGALGC